MEPIALPEDFKEFLRLLNQAQIEYLVIGGYAVGFHGYPRATNDLDVWVNSSPANIAAVVQVLKQFGFDVPVLAEWAKNPVKSLRMGLPPVRLEVLTHISGVEFGHAYPERVQAVLDGVRVPLVSLARLKQNKKAAGRSKDLADLENLP